MDVDPGVRRAVRVLLVDDSERVLLLRSQHPDSGVVFWLAPGGGIDAGEDAPAAARREVREETGLDELELEAEVWHRRHVFTWRGVRYDQRERWFLARVKPFTPDMSGVTEAEKSDLSAWRWWTPEELAAATDDLAPRDLAARLRALLRDGPPETPAEIGI